MAQFFSVLLFPKMPLDEQHLRHWLLPTQEPLSMHISPFGLALALFSESLLTQSEAKQ